MRARQSERSPTWPQSGWTPRETVSHASQRVDVGAGLTDAEGDSEPRSDIYSLTCVLYECLTGEPPFAGANLEQQITAHLMTPPPKPSATDAKPPKAFDAVIEKGLAK